MPENLSVRKWLAKNGYEDVVVSIDQIMAGWQTKGTKTRRSWWDILAGGKDGKPRTIEGITFPILKAAQIRMGIPITKNALCRSETEAVPPIVYNGRWKDKEMTKRSSL
jgi:uncharacterized spore protein YtfJ